MDGHGQDTDMSSLSVKGVTTSGSHYPLNKSATENFF